MNPALSPTELPRHYRFNKKRRVAKIKKFICQFALEYKKADYHDKLGQKNELGMPWSIIWHTICRIDDI